ncbi:MAG: hypothetical protein IT472_07230 [Thermomonas sp.]|uniref:hypothetical protein n=1 Tax=Thermomonas sp. TaxID=1971895 RepID=UPI0026364224|nr:hypothetical protein [Thermomonas sp.]MCC7096952.1 hypothetical protein [Thermomonas sp.]
MTGPDHLRTAPRFALLLCGALVLSWLSGCRPTPETAATDASGLRNAAAERPVDAVLVLRDRLLARDGAGFAHVALPPALHAQVETAWRAGRSRWPLEELPLDGDIPRMLAALQEPGATRSLMDSFHRQFAGADGDIDQAVRTLVVFGRSYLQKDPDYNDEQRKHIDQAMMALGDWALAAPLSDPNRAQHLFSALAASATRTGIDGRHAKTDLARLGMTAGLARLSRFYATLLTQMRLQYGLDFDASLRSAQVSLLQQTGDTARLRLQYQFAGQPVDAIIPVVRIDGHWYLADYVADARRSLASPPAVAVPSAAPPPKP